MNIAVILAGGIGSRVGSEIPKQFIEVLGKPVLAYTIDIFQQSPEIDAIEVVCLSSYLTYVSTMKEEYNFTKLRWITEGGSTFQESVYNGVKYLENKIDDNDILLIHFGASPFIEDDIISDAIRVCRDKGNAISSTDFYLLSGFKEYTTSVEDSDNFSAKYIDRDTIACMSTPHAFNYKFIRDLYDEAISSGIIDTVEPHTTTLMYKMGKTIFFSKGSQTNIKITRKEDLDLFEGYVLMKQRREMRGG